MGRTEPGDPFGHMARTSGHRCSKGVVLPAALPSSPRMSCTCPQGRWGPQLGWSRGLVVASHRLSAPAAERPPPWTRQPQYWNPDASRFLARACAAVRDSGTSAGVLGASDGPSASPGIAASPLVSVAFAPAGCTRGRSTCSRGRSSGTPPPTGRSLCSRTAFRRRLRLLASIRWASRAHRAET